MRLFIDNNLPSSLAKSLHELSAPYNHEVWHLTHKFNRTTPDHEWINCLAKEGDWVIVTQDRLKKNPLEKQALRNSKLTTFFLKKSWADQPYWEKSWKLIRWWPRIIEQVERVEGGATFMVSVQFSGKGKFEQFNY